MLETIKNKFILLDTCVLIDAASYRDEFASFFSELKKYEILPGYDETVRLEFLRTSNTRDSLIAKNQFLQLLLGDEANRFNLPVNENVINAARHLSIISNYLGGKKGSTISAGDAMIAAQLKIHEHNLFLATTNLRDFSVKLFERIGTYNIDVGDVVKVIGIYRYSKEKYKQSCQRL